ncbi:MAG: UDP-2,4-diacetamido-2,4,6-trideoxy-beta-L-altropyranose hydrolase [Bacteroidota bacterium]
MQVFFRADGNSNIGLGHLIRSLALAQMLKPDFQATFLVQNPSKSIQAQIREAHKLISLPQREDYLAEAKQIVEQFISPQTLIVLDGYAFATEYQRILKTAGAKIICIDDLRAYYFLADAIINHAEGLPEKAYSCEPQTQLFLGTQYALLRTPFREATKKSRIIREIKSVFVCLGGADPKNFSKEVVEVCLAQTQIQSVHLVLGSAYLFRDSLKELEGERLKIHEDLNADQMCALMQETDVGIVPASGISYEACAVRLPILVGWYMDNQQDLYQFLTQNGLAVGVGNFESLVEKLSQFTPTQAQQQAQEHYFDGQTAERFKRIFRQFSLQKRLAQPEDMQLYFDWANDPAVRENSLNSEAIPWDSHQEWFLRKLQSPTVQFFLFEFDDQKVGQVRIEEDDAAYWINYSVSANQRGKGWCFAMVKATVQELKGRPIKAYVKVENQASIRIFEKLQFREVERKKGVITFLLD